MIVEQVLESLLGLMEKFMKESFNMIPELELESIAI
jgi:hypothetical protein